MTRKIHPLIRKEIMGSGRYPEHLAELLPYSSSILLEYEKYYVQLGMRKYGGSFVMSLGCTLSHADMSNSHKINETWPELWDEYLEIGIRLEHPDYNGDEND